MEWSSPTTWLILYLATCLLPWLIKAPKARSATAWLPPLAGLLLLAIQRNEPAYWRLLVASAGLLYLLKGTILLKESAQTIRKIGPAKFLLFMTAWPGMDPKPFAETSQKPKESGERFVRGLLFTYVGVALAAVLILFYPAIPPTAVGWLGIAAILLTVHFGISDIMSSLADLCGLPAGPLFENPLKSKSLSDFWTARWNLPFVQMDRLLFIRPLTKRLGMKGAVFAVFLISGVLHELAISYAAGGGYGEPLLYFTIQGALVLAERRFKHPSKLATWLAIIVPLPLLFHQPFQKAFILPLFHGLHNQVAAHTIRWFFDHGLWLVGIMQLLVLIASFQVPFRLNWREELPRLSSLNRKLMQTNGAFIVLTIVAFGTLTLTLHPAFMRGESAAIALSIFIATFWAMRILVDCFYYKSEDWPAGPQFVIGHALLDSLFTFLMFSYGAYAVWRLA